jgi:hypothetical protein
LTAPSFEWSPFPLLSPVLLFQDDGENGPSVVRTVPARGDHATRLPLSSQCSWYPSRNSAVCLAPVKRESAVSASSQFWGFASPVAFLPEGRLECRDATMLKLVAMPYSVEADCVLGGPEWLASDRFDVIAKAPSRQTSPADLRRMLQWLLADRFLLGRPR